MVRERRTIKGTTFEAWPEQGAWYEIGEAIGRPGMLYAPMNRDGSFDPEEIGEIEVAYENA